MERVRKPVGVREDAALILKTPTQGAAKVGEPDKVPAKAPEVAAERVAEEAAGNNVVDQNT